ncbi:U5 small nuclear ribonucleoprotein 200kDa subunit (nucleomorph) [Lotharella oceanica]|uniref:U5 small nuclear ribonucleoprotein 200kDa subunit n=2 Tax=Lotharella oceanica TaxID=641309 RepID=A0A060DHQ4_9EUKA|nr:U5 small nuclear ribonucleoprotein 200kDa subunit [Lotharella oceanica]
MEYNNSKNANLYMKINDLLIFDFIRKKIGISSSEVIDKIFKRSFFLFKEYKNKNILFIKYQKIFQYLSKLEFDFLIHLIENSNKNIKNKIHNNYLIEKIFDKENILNNLSINENETLLTKNKYINSKSSFKKKNNTLLYLKKEDVINGILMFEKLDSDSAGHEIIQKIYKFLMEYDDKKIEAHLIGILGFNNIKLIRFIINNKNIFINCLLIKKEIENIDQNNIKQHKKRKNFLKILKNSNLDIFSKVLKKKIYYSDNIKSFLTSSENKSVKSFKLPLGSYKLTTPLFDEINISFIVNRNNKKIKEFIKLDNLPDIFKKAFKSIKNFNYIQSKVYPMIINSNSNILLCAPTGSGKTLVAFLCTLKVLILLKNLVFKEITIYSPSVFYLAPMKALIKEITKKMKHIFQNFEVEIIDVTTDKKITKNDFKNKFVVITTPEKLDAITRKPYNNNVIKFMKLVILDEIHLLNSDRGVSIESLIARIRYFCDIYKRKIRLLSLSATFPNYIDLAELFHIKNGKGLFYFDENFRSCSINYHLLGAKPSKFMDINEIIYEILKENLISFLDKNNQIIVFVHSRKDTLLTGNLLNEILKFKKNNDALELENKLDEVINESGCFIDINSIKKLLKKKIGIHNAGMNKKFREMIEDMFKERMIKIIVSTATLAWGVNLPSKVVIVKGTKIYSPKINGWIEISILDLIQMFGRAGRPQFDKNGVGILITSIENIKYYTSLFNNNVEIESFFHRYIISFLNAEIANGVICSLSMSINWLFLTYYSIRVKKKMFSWLIQERHKIIQKEYLKVIKKTIHKSLGKLENINFINYDGSNLYSSEIGRISSFNIVNYITIEYLSKCCKFVPDDNNFLKLLVRSVEFKNIIVRIEELIELNQFFDIIPIPVDLNINLAYIKIIILIENYISKSWVSGTVLQCDSSFIIQNILRIIRAISQISLKKLNLVCFKLSLKFFKMIDNQLWNVLIPYRQIKLIPEYFFTKITNNKMLFNNFFFKIMSEKNLDFIISEKTTTIKSMFLHFPVLKIKSISSPVSNELIIVQINIVPNFKWNEEIHAASEFFWLIISDSNNSKIIYYDLFSLKKNNIKSLIFFNILLSIKITKIPLLFIEIISDRWLRSEFVMTISIKDLIFSMGLKYKLDYMNLGKQLNHDKNILYFKKFKKVSKLFERNEIIFLKKFVDTDKDIYIVVSFGYNKKMLLNFILLSRARDVTIKKNKQRNYYLYSYKKKNIISLEEYKNDFFQSCIHHPKEGIIICFINDQEKNFNFNNFSMANLFEFNPILDFNKFNKINNKNLLLIVDEFLFDSLEERAEIEFIITKIKILNVKKKYGIRSIYFSFLYNNYDDLCNWLFIRKEFIINLYEKNKNKMLLKYFEKYLVNSSNREVLYQSYYLINVSNKLNDLFVVIFPTIINVYEFIENLDIYFEYFRENDNSFFLNRVKISKFLKILYYRGIGLFLKIKDFVLREFSISTIISSYISTLISSVYYWNIIPVKFVKILVVYNEREDYGNFSENNKIFLFLNKFISKWIKKNKIYIFLSNNYKNIIHNYEKCCFLNSTLSTNIDKFFNNLFVIIRDKKRDIFRSFLTWTFLEKSIKRNPNYYRLENSDIKNLNFYYNGLIQKFFLNLDKLKITNTTKKINKKNSNIFLLVNKYNINQKIVFQIKKKLITINSYKVILKILNFLLENDTSKNNINAILEIFSNYELRFIHNRTNFCSVNLYKTLIKYMQREIIIEEIKDCFADLLKKCYTYLNFLLDLSILKGNGYTTLLFLEFIQVFNQALPNKKLINFQIPFFSVTRNRISNDLRLNEISDFHYLDINCIKKSFQISMFESREFSCYVGSRYSISIYYIHKKKVNITNSILKDYIYSIITENSLFANDNNKWLKYNDNYIYEKNIWIIVMNVEKNILLFSKKLNIEYNNKFKLIIEKGICYFSIIITNLNYLGYEIAII